MHDLSSPTQERSVITRAGLLTAVVDCLIEAGYAGTTIRAVADKAGASPGAVQHHFGTRDRMLTAAIDFLVQKLVAGLGRLSERPQHEPPLVRARNIIGTLWDFYGGAMNTALLEVLVGARTNPVLHQEINRLRAGVIDAYMEQWVKLLRDSRLPRREKEDLLQFCIATVRGLALTQYFAPDSPDFFNRQLDRLAHMVASAILSASAQRAARTQK